MASGGLPSPRIPTTSGAGGTSSASPAVQPTVLEPVTERDGRGASWVDHGSRSSAASVRSAGCRAGGFTRGAAASCIAPGRTRLLPLLVRRVESHRSRRPLSRHQSRPGAWGTHPPEPSNRWEVDVPVEAIQGIAGVPQLHDLPAAGSRAGRESAAGLREVGDGLRRPARCGRGGRRSARWRVASACVSRTKWRR